MLLSQVSVDGQVIASYGGLSGAQPIANLITLAAPLRLSPRHRRLEFDFTAVNFSAPENVCFLYQLGGFDDDWIEADRQRSVAYSRLPAAAYHFRVEACNGDGPWTETPATMSVIVTPFFWQTWWFRATAVLIFTSSLIAIVRYASFRRLRTMLLWLEQRAALDRERSRIARDLHDDLGCSLNKVALTLDMTRRGIAQPSARHLRKASRPFPHRGRHEIRGTAGIRTIPRSTSNLFSHTKVIY